MPDILSATMARWMLPELGLKPTCVADLVGPAEMHEASQRSQ